MALREKIKDEYLSFLELLKIEPSYSLPEATGPSHVENVYEVLKGLIPFSLFEETSTPAAFFYRLSKMIPLTSYPQEFGTQQAVPITFLCPSEYTAGVGRFLADSLVRWLVPGRQFPVIGRVSLNIRFIHSPASRFYFSQELLVFEDKNDVELAKKNLPSFLEDLKINIMSVYQARYIASLKSAKQPYRNLFLQESLSSLVNGLNTLDQSLFDEFQGFFTKVSTEERIHLVHQNISNLIHTRPKAFDRDIFYEVAHYSSLFKEQFASKSNPKFIARVIAYQHLFKKIIQERLDKNPAKRHFAFKLLRAPHAPEAISILLCFNFLRESECFELRHILEGLKNSPIPLDYISDSFIADRRHEKIRFFYLELKKKGQMPFTLQELKSLKTELPAKLLQEIDTSVHPIFMPRNEEEVLRGIILLSKQIKFVKDLAQVSIHYDMQSESDLNFTVILVRLIRPKSLEIQDILEKLSPLKVELDDVRSAGYLKRKYLKEAAILRLTLDKEEFFRADQSVDLLKARQKIVFSLKQAMGEFRDFNGGIILKQDEALSVLRKVALPKHPEEELLLENYFYSLRPAIMQTVYETELLRIHFSMLFTILATDLQNKLFQVETRAFGKYLLVFVGASFSSFKAPVMQAIQRLRIPSYDLSTSSMETEKKAVLGAIYRFGSEKEKDLFKEKLFDALEKWKKQVNLSS